MLSGNMHMFRDSDFRDSDRRDGRGASLHRARLRPIQSARDALRRLLGRALDFAEQRGRLSGRDREMYMATVLAKV